MNGGRPTSRRDQFLPVHPASDLSDHKFATERARKAASAGVDAGAAERSSRPIMLSKSHLLNALRATQYPLNPGDENRQIVLFDDINTRTYQIGTDTLLKVLIDIIQKNGASEEDIQQIIRRLDALGDYAAAHPDKTLVECAVELITEPQRASKPDKAPALWSDRKTPDASGVAVAANDSPVEFINRYYEPWLGNGLTRADIGTLDRPLYLALAKWLSRNPIPKGFDLPTVKERNDRWVDAIRAQGGEAVAGMTAREASRFYSNVNRRKPSQRDG